MKSFAKCFTLFLFFLALSPLAWAQAEYDSGEDNARQYIQKHGELEFFKAMQEEAMKQAEEEGLDPDLAVDPLALSQEDLKSFEILSGLLERFHSPMNVALTKLLVEIFKRPAENAPYPYEFLTLRENGRLIDALVISSGRGTNSTRAGSFKVQWTNMGHRSSLYRNAPMPYAIFFNGNIAVHGVLEEHWPNLGGPASAGCVRTSVGDGKKLWDHMQRVGRANMNFTVHANGHAGPDNAGEARRAHQMVNQSIHRLNASLEAWNDTGLRDPHWPSSYRYRLRQQ